MGGGGYTWTTVRQPSGVVRAEKVLREERTRVRGLSHPHRSVRSNSARSSAAGPSRALLPTRLAATARRRARRYLDGVASRRARATTHPDHQIVSEATERGDSVRCLFGRFEFRLALSFAPLLFQLCRETIALFDLCLEDCIWLSSCPTVVAIDCTDAVGTWSCAVKSASTGRGRRLQGQPLRSWREQNLCRRLTAVQDQGKRDGTEFCRGRFALDA